MFLAAVMMTSIFAACGGEETPPVEESVKLWYGYNTENFMQDYEYPELMPLITAGSVIQYTW